MRKFLTYLCALMLMSSSAFSYYGSYSAYDLYQLASSGNIRALQNATNSGGNINATDSNGQSAICYAIVNQDYTAYRNLTVLHADEHPSCVNRISKQDYENFKRGYELRGGKISSSFSLSGSTAAWTIAGIATVGAGVAIAAGGGGGGGGGGSSSSGGDPEPTPPPTPPAEQCKSFTLTQCPKNAVCDSCLASTGFLYKITGCKEGYVLNNGCIPAPSVPKNYPLEQCDPNGRCISAMYGDVKMYRLISCNEDYVLSSDGLACEFICPGYIKESCEETQYISAKCPKKDTYHICTERENTDHCSGYETEADRCTACYDSNQRKYKLIDGVCVEECKGMTQASCEREQYISEICADNNKFHTCTTRTHTEGCAGYDDYADKCTGCEEDYILRNGICEEFCKGYTKEDCNIDTQYEASVCPDDPTHIYHTCKDRTFIKGCKNYNPKADKCSECEDGYKLSDGTCIQICVGYNKSCKISTHYQGERCSDDKNYYKCEVRTNTKGCKDWVINEDKCSSCRDGYELQANGTCKSVCSDEYQDEDCDKLEYIPAGGICPEDSRFHKCKARTVTYGCKEYDLYADKCTSCLEDYELNGGACQDKCPESTKEACNNNTHWRLDDCPKDSRFHKCIFRLNTIGCAKYSETSDTCTECNGTSSTPVSGKCSCDGYYAEECDKPTEYVSTTCATAAGYHVCSPREHTEGCTDYDIYSDTCTACVKADYYLPTSHICTLREHTEGCKTVYENDDTCLSCDKENYYLNRKSGRSDGICTQREKKDGCEIFNEFSDSCLQCTKATHYLNASNICTPRENTDHCKTFEENADKCKSCEEDFKLENGFCVPMCKNYQKESCDTEDFYEVFDCPDESGLPANMKKYRTCNERTNYTGCTRFITTEDKCKECDDYHTLQGNGTCAANSSLCPGYTKSDCNFETQYMPLDEQGGIQPFCTYDNTYHRCVGRDNSTDGCANLDRNNDRCNKCEDGYTKNPENTNECIEKCPASKGYTTEDCGEDYYVPSENKCQYDPTYHICKLRTNDYSHCVKRKETADKCDKCEDGYSPNSSGVCDQVCPGYQIDACDNEYFWTGDTCAGHPEYHKCNRRTNTTYCTKFDSGADKCTDCKDGYKVNASNGKCEQICPGYKKEACGSGLVEGEICADDVSYHKCERAPDEKVIPGCKEYTADNQKCKACEGWYILSGGGTSCTPSSTNSANCEKPVSGQDCCQTCATGFKVESCACVFDESLIPSGGGSGGDDSGGGSGGGDSGGGDSGGGSGDTTGCTSASCESGYHEEKGNCEGDEHRCVADGGDTSGCQSASCQTGYYEEKSNCSGDEHKCVKSTNVFDCDTYKKYEDGCEICENGYGIGNNTGNNVPDSNGLCSEQSNSGVNGNCKLSCNLTIEYENQELNSECDGGKVFCAIRRYATNCQTFSQYADRCTACQSGVQLKKADSSDTDGYCLTTNGCQTSPQACLENDKINTYYALVGTSISDDKLKTVYNKMCETAQTSEAVCVERTQIANCAQYAQLSDKCSKCEYDSNNKCLGISINNVCYADKYGLCEGNAGFSGEAAENYGNTYSSKIVKVFEVSEDKENGQSVFVALDNKLDTFNAAIRQYNGYKSDSTQRIIVSGEFENATDITGAYNVNNGSLKGGIGTIEISRNEESPTPITGAIKGLVGGNNYENSAVVIDIDVNDATADNKRSFIAGMGKEVGAYKADDSDEINGIDLGSATHGQHNADLINAGNVDISSGGTAQVYGMLGLRHADNVANHSEDRELGDFINASTGKINISSPNAKEIYGIRVNNLINKAGLSDKFSNVTNDGTINISGGSNVYGIAAKNANIYNNGDININATGDNVYGIHADRSNVENSGNITINSGGGNAYGIYAINGSNVKNSGVITINNNEFSGNYADGKSIYVDPTSYILNANTIISDTPLNTVDFGGGDIVMTNGANITAPEVSGKLTLSSDITTGSNNNIYTLQNMVNGNTQNLDIVSQSAMFKASSTTENGTVDGTLTRNSFNELINNNSLADYLDKNYEAGNAMSLFDDLKNLETLAKLKDGIKDFFGQNMLPRMTFEDMSMMREVNLDMNKNLFAQEGAFSFGGNVSPYTYDNNVGSVGRYALNGFNYGKLSYGLGISISDVSTYDDNQENSRNDRSFVMSMPVGRKLHGFEFITSPKIGYAYGEYTRNGFNNSYDGKVYKRMFALMNEARYPMDIGKMKFTPSAEFNMIGFNVKGSEEDHKTYNLRIPSQNHYSVEAGIGLLTEKNFNLYNKHLFKINAGVAFYHEFANPYEIDVCMSEMDGMYRLHDEKRHSNRTVVRTGFDYEWGRDVELSASLLSNIDGEYRTDAVCDVKYHF